MSKNSKLRALLAHNPKAVDMQGNRIVADRFYTSEAPKLVDHFEKPKTAFKKLKAAYTLNGEMGEQQYLDSVAKLMEQAMADLEQKKHTNENKQPAN